MGTFSMFLTYLEVDFFHFLFQFLTGFLNLSHFSEDMEIHEDNMAKDQDGTQQDKNKSKKCGLCSYSSKWPSTLKCHMMVHICHKDFTCKQCDYSCAHAGKLKQNIQAKSRLNVHTATFFVQQPVISRLTN